MNDATARLELPLLQPGQAQKEMTHNEALARIDLALGGAVVSAGANAPPASPQPGQAWIVGPAPTGAWAGRANTLAGWTAGGWRFVDAPEGYAAWDSAAAVMRRREGAGWSDGTVAAAGLAIGGRRVVGPRQPAIGAPEGGGTVDEEARATIGAVLAALRMHGLIEP